MLTSDASQVGRHRNRQRQVASSELGAVLLDGKRCLPRDTENITGFVKVAGKGTRALGGALADGDGKVAALLHPGEGARGDDLLGFTGLADTALQEGSSARVHDIAHGLFLGDEIRVGRVVNVNWERLVLETMLQYFAQTSFVMRHGTRGYRALTGHAYTSSESPLCADDDALGASERESCRSQESPRK